MVDGAAVSNNTTINGRSFECDCVCVHVCVRAATMDLEWYSRPQVHVPVFWISQFSRPGFFFFSPEFRKSAATQLQSQTACRTGYTACSGRYDTQNDSVCTVCAFRLPTHSVHKDGVTKIILCSGVIIPTTLHAKYDA